MTWKGLAIHVCCWILFISYEVGISSYFGDHSSLVEFGVFYLLDILLFYGNAHLVFFKFIPARNLYRIGGLITSMVVELLLYTYLSVILNNSFKHIAGVQIFNVINFSVAIMAVWRAVYFIGLSTAYWAVLKSVRTTKLAQKAAINEINSLREKERLEIDIIMLQNAFLQARINPHFLFNTLNFIFNQVEEGNPDAANNILLLSEIMHYSLGNLEPDGKVPLSGEIEHIKRYIQLNKSRFDNKLNLIDRIEYPAISEARVPPLLLLTFVENVFKHGDMTSDTRPGIIEISQRDDLLLFHTKNRKNRNPSGRSQGLGIKNAKTRLKNYYGDTAVLNIDNSEDHFILSLKIQL